MIKNLFDYSIKCDELSTDTNIKANIAQYEPNNNLTDYLNFYINNDNLFFNCENCHSSTRFDTSKEFTKLPPVLVITLQRFKTQKMYRTKVDTLITFPLNGLYISNNEYDLYGVINHSGDIENGHYTSIVKVDAKWIFFDDSKYEEVKDPHQLISELAHVLSEKAKSNCKKIFCDFFFEGEPVRVKDEEGFVVKVKGDKIVIRFVLGVIKTLSRKNVEKLLSVEG